MVKLITGPSGGEAFQRDMVMASLHPGDGPVVVQRKDMTKECVQTARCVCDIVICLFSMPFVLLYTYCCCRGEKDSKIDKL